MIFYNILAGTLCKNSGWGKTSNGVLPHMPDELQVVSIPVIEQDTCAELYKEWDLLYDGEVCGGATTFFTKRKPWAKVDDGAKSEETSNMMRATRLSL